MPATPQQCGDVQTNKNTQMKTYEIIGRISGGHDLSMKTEFITASSKEEAKSKSTFDYIKKIHFRKDIKPTYKIDLVFNDPYIGSRNGGNRILHTGLSFAEAKSWLLKMRNDLLEGYHTTFETAIRYYRKHQTIDGLYRGEDGYYLEYDSRMYKMIQE